MFHIICDIIMIRIILILSSDNRCDSAYRSALMKCILNSLQFFTTRLFFNKYSQRRLHGYILLRQRCTVESSVRNWCPVQRYTTWVGRWGSTRSVRWTKISSAQAVQDCLATMSPYCRTDHLFFNTNSTLVRPRPASDTIARITGRFPKCPISLPSFGPICSSPSKPYCTRTW